MNKIEVFDPPLCCSTGVCGPKVDPALVRFAADLHWLANQKIAVERYNLAQQPQAFASREAVKAALRQHGNGCLPLILLNGAVVSQGRYPDRDELARLAGVEPDRSVKLPVIHKRCC
ncbi:MAG: arsenite efflux transporter metallochaperone ArsD [Bryobacteraceae bacterium]